MRRLALFALLSSSALAQEPAPWRAVPEVPGPAATAVAQDAAGYVWVGTQNGLVRWDGHEARVFRPDARDPRSLPSAAVNVGALLPTPDGSVWVGTERGLCQASPARQGFRCTAHLSPRHPLARADVVALARAPDGAIWAGTTAGLFRTDPRTLATQRAEGLPSPYVAALSVGPSGTVWAGTSRGLAVLPEGERAFRLVPGVLSGAHVSALLPASGGVWAAALGHGLYRASPGASRRVYATTTAIFGLAAAPDSTLRLATWGEGLLTFDPETESVKRGPSPSGRVVATRYDREGSLWAASWDGLFVSPRRPPFRLLSHDPGALSASHVTSVLPDGAGGAWVATATAGLDRCDADGACRPVPACHDALLRLVPDRGGIWTATSEQGVCYMDASSGTPSRPFGPGSAHVYDLLPTHGERALLATASDGLLRQGPGGTDTLDAPPFDLVPAYSLERGARGTTWIGTLGAGLCTLLPDDTADCFPVGEGGTLSSWGTALAPTPRGLWAGGESGLDWVPHGGTPVPVLSRATLADPRVACVLPTASGVWVSSASGLLRLDPETHAVTLNATALGLPDLRYDEPACAALGDGRLAFGSRDGLLVFRPDDFGSPASPPTRITRVSVDGEDVPLADELVLEPQQGGPTFHVATLSFVAPAQRRYQVRLRGHDQEWSEPTATSAVPYSRLPPGRYTFEVRNAALTDAPPASLTVRVLAPLWRRPWALALEALALLVVLVALYRARLGYLLRIERERAAARERVAREKAAAAAREAAVRQQIADDLHDDLGSRLGGLAFSLDLAATDLPPRTQAEIRPIADAARALHGRLRQTLWAVGVDEGTADALLHRIRDAALFLFPDGRASVTASGDLSRPLGGSLRQHLFLFASEALHNAARHGRPQTITVHLDATGPLTLTVTDDGQGFSPGAASGGRGLATLRRRAEALGAELRIDSAPGQGTTVALRLP